MFQTVDPAASSTDIWKRGNVGVSPGEPSWTVISTWFLTTDWNLIWWRVARFRVEIPEVLARIKSEFRRCIDDRDGQPEFVGVEANGLGIGVFQMAANAGLPVRDLRPRGMDKLVRATDAINRMEMGKIWLPEQAPWLDECETEVFTWTAHPMEQADQIDTLAYAAQLVSAEASGSEQPTSKGNVPLAIASTPGNPWFRF
jgi:phage terminase large subunit-like protein